MNPKIKELALQAGGSHYPEVGGKTLEKFAELIVAECADFLRDTLDDHFAAEQLEEHFGVE
jgi:hypothetical protein